MSWASVTKSEASSHKKNKDTKTVMVAPDTSWLEAPDDLFYHRHSRKLEEVYEYLVEYTEYEGLSELLMSKMTITDLVDFAQETTSEYRILDREYKNRLKKIYAKARTKTVTTVDSSENDDSDEE